MDNHEATTEAAVIADIAPDAVETVTTPGHDTHAFHRNDYHLHVIKTDEWSLEQPTRQRGTTSHAILDSLLAYTEFLGTDSTVVWIDKSNRRITTVFNDHHPAEPGFGDHTATWAPTAPPVTHAWMSQLNTWMKQERLGKLLAEHGQVIAEPSHGEMLELVETFQATVKAKVKSGVRQQDGARQIMFEEEINATAGDYMIPNEILVVLPALDEALDGIPDDDSRLVYALNLSLQYRINDGEIMFKLVNHDVERQEAMLFDMCLQHARAELGEDRPVFMGNPTPRNERTRGQAF